MDRNFFRRIEICFPVLDPKLKRRVIREGLIAYLKDNSQPWEMSGDGQYHQKNPRRAKTPSAQQTLLLELSAKAAK